MSDHILEAQTRTLVGRKTDALRAQSQIPAVVYGVGTQPQMISVDYNTFLKVYKTAGESTIVELNVDEGTPLHVLIQDFQLDPLRNEVTHVDFRSIDMTKEIEATVQLEFTGESPAVKGLGGTLVPSRDHVAIRCLPNKLMRSIAVDISALKTFQDVIRISDLAVPEGVIIVEDPSFTIVMVEEPRSEEEMKQLDAAVEENVTEVAVAGKDKEAEAEEPETQSKEQAS